MRAEGGGGGVEVRKPQIAHLIFDYIECEKGAAPLRLVLMYFCNETDNPIKCALIVY